MAENQVRPMNRVRNMYEGVDPDRMSKQERKAHTERVLQDNLDVLFRAYQQGRHHMVIFRTSHPGEWMSAIQSRVTAMSFQLVKKRAVNNFFTFTLSGSLEGLQCFCADFDQLHDDVMERLQDGEEEAQKNPQDDVEQLRERIRELELENKQLRRRRRR